MKTPPEPINPWTKKELDLLIRHFPNTTNEDLSIIIGTRTHGAIAHKASRLHLRKSQEFLNSAASGRYRARISFRQRFINWLISILS